MTSGFINGELVLDATVTSGTWIPDYNGSTPGTTNYTTQEGSFLKIGKLVIAAFHVVTITSSGTGNARMEGLPFATANNSVAQYFAVEYAQAPWPAGKTQIGIELDVNGTGGTLVGSENNTGNVPVTIDASIAEVRGTFTYLAEN